MTYLGKPQTSGSLVWDGEKFIDEVSSGGGSGSGSLQTSFDNGNTILITSSNPADAFIISASIPIANQDQPVLELVEKSNRVNRTLLAARSFFASSNTYFFRGYMAGVNESVRIWGSGNSTGNSSGKIFTRGPYTSPTVHYGFLNNAGLVSNIGFGAGNGTKDIVLMGASNNGKIIFKNVNKIKNLAEFSLPSTNNEKFYIHTPTYVSSTLSIKEGFILDPSPSKTSASYGSDVNFVVTGSAGGRGTVANSTGLFLGDLHISGNITVDGTAKSIISTTVELTNTRSLNDADNGNIIVGSNLNDIKIIVPGTLSPGVSVVLMPDNTGGQMVISGGNGVTLLAKSTAANPLSTLVAWDPVTVVMRTTGSAFVYGGLA